MHTQNAVTQSFALLDEQWESFVDEGKPILYWQAPTDARELLRAYVAHKELFDENSNDFFIGLNSHFQHAKTHASTLTKELNQKIHDGLAASLDDDEHETTEEEPALRWAAPTIAPQENGFKGLMESCQAALDAFGDYFEHFVLLLNPATVETPKDYAKWLAACGELYSQTPLWPERLKIVFLDCSGASNLSDTAKTHPAEMVKQQAPLNVRLTMNTLLQEANDNSDAAKLRQYIFDLNYAIADQHEAQMYNNAEKAIALATRMKSIETVATVLMIRAAGYLQLKDYEKALTDYQHAFDAATKGEKEEKLGCDKLRMQAKLCEATAHVSAEDYLNGALTYQAASKLADQYGDTFIGLESLRMLSFCCEQLKEKDAAWLAAEQALTLAKDMDEEARKNSTLPFLGQAMLRIYSSSKYQDYTHQRMQALLGEHWQDAATSNSRNESDKTKEGT